MIWFLVEALSPACRWLPSHGVFTSPLYIGRERLSWYKSSGAPSYEDTNPIRSGAHSCAYSKYIHIRGQGFNPGMLERTQFTLGYIPKYPSQNGPAIVFPLCWHPLAKSRSWDMRPRQDHGAGSADVAAAVTFPCPHRTEGMATTATG